MRDADSRGLSVPSWERSRAQGSDLLEKQFIYEGIWADLCINTNNGKLLSHHKPYYDNMFLITVFGLPVVRAIFILCYEHGVLIVARMAFNINAVWSRSGASSDSFSQELCV